MKNLQKAMMENTAEISKTIKRLEGLKGTLLGKIKDAGEEDIIQIKNDVSDIDEQIDKLRYSLEAAL